jgi:hypothetical protein
MLTFILPGTIFVAGEIISAFFFGIVIAQVASLSLWAILGPSRLVDRVPVTGFLAILMCFLLLLGLRLIEEAAPARVAAELGLSVLGTYASCLFPFWLARRFLRWRIVRFEESPHAQQRHASQFSIGRLLLWTAGIGVSLAAAKWLVPINDWAQMSRLPLDVLLTAVFSLAFVTLHVFAAMPCVWLALRVEQDRIVWAFLLAVYCAAVTLIDAVVLAIVAQGEMIGYLYVSFFLMNAGLMVSMIGNLTYVRRLGYQLAPQAWPPASYLASFDKERAHATGERPEHAAAESATPVASKSSPAHQASAHTGGNGQQGARVTDRPDG